MKALFDLVHTNVCGPFTIASLSHVDYVFMFINDYNKFDWVFFLKKKMIFFFNSSNSRQKLNYNLRSPLWPYVLTKEERISLLILCKDHGIIQQFTQTNIPHRMVLQKDEIEPSLNELKVLLLVQTFLLALWAKIVNIANYLTNYLLLK
jgi:hypothetical protein